MSNTNKRYNEEFKKENQRLKMENDILKQAALIPSLRWGRP